MYICNGECVKSSASLPFGDLVLPKFGRSNVIHGSATRHTCLRHWQLRRRLQWRCSSGCRGLGWSAGLGAWRAWVSLRTARAAATWYFYIEGKFKLWGFAFYPSVRTCIHTCLGHHATVADPWITFDRPGRDKTVRTCAKERGARRRRGEKPSPFTRA